MDTPAAGEVNFGVTERFLRSIKYPKKPRDLTLDEARNIYLKYFWIPLGVEKLESDRIATAIFCQAVNGGQGRAVNLAITALRRVGMPAPVRIQKRVDESLARILNQTPVDRFIDEYREMWRRYYTHLVAFNPDFKKHYPGWMNRLREL